VETDCAKAARLKKCVTDADSLSQLESQHLSELFIDEAVRRRIQDRTLLVERCGLSV
jgi:hypothetical protein